MPNVAITLRVMSPQVGRFMKYPACQRLRPSNSAKTDRHWGSSANVVSETVQLPVAEAGFHEEVAWHLWPLGVRDTSNGNPGNVQNRVFKIFREL